MRIQHTAFLLVELTTSSYPNEESTGWHEVTIVDTLLEIQSRFLVFKYIYVLVNLVFYSVVV